MSLVSKRRSFAAFVALTVVALSVQLFSGVSYAASTYAETVGGNAHTWTDPSNAGGTEGPLIQSGWTVQIACVVQGFRVSDGNTNWYRVDQSPWSNQYYVSADAFYNNGATSGSLQGTPYVDPSVPSCSSLPTGTSETAGGVAHTWTNPANAGGIEGPSVAGGQVVQITCKLTGFRVADGNTWWYQIGSSPWSNNYFVSADAFYNNGATSGSLVGTPYVDPAVPTCTGSSSGGGGDKTLAQISLTQGPAASAGYRYAINLRGFAANSTVPIRCYDSVSSGGFYTFSARVDGSGSYYTASYCYSGDGPDHWVTAPGVASNHVSWGPGSSSSGGGSSGGGNSGTWNGGPSTKLAYFALGDSYSSGEGNPPFLTSGGTCDRSHAAWPYQLALKDGLLTWLGSTACSGAVMADVPFELKAIQGDRAVQLITVTIGGNDAQFAGVLTVCYTEHLPKRNCVSDGTLAKTSVRIQGLYSGLVKTYKLIHLAASNAQLVVVGYPRLFPMSQSSTTGCGWLSNDMRNDLNILQSELTLVISRAAAASGARYIGIDNALNGHELCTAHSWINPIEPNPYDRRAAHPLAAGQNAMEVIVKDQLHKWGLG